MNLLELLKLSQCELGSEGEIPAGARHTYQLTDKGLALYPVPLAMFMWGDRWLAGGDPPISLDHKGDHRLRAVLTCSHCAMPVTRADLQMGYTWRTNSTRWPYWTS